MLTIWEGLYILWFYKVLHNGILRSYKTVFMVNSDDRFIQTLK